MSQIPNYPLRHDEEIVTFAIRSMEQIDDAAERKSDLPHRHDYYSIIWLKEGRGVHHIDFKSYPLGEQCVFFITPGQVHQLVPETHPSGVVVLFTDEFMINQGIEKKLLLELNLFEDCGENPPIQLREKDISVLTDLSYNIFKEYESADEFSYAAIASYLRLWLIQCHRAKQSIDLKVHLVDIETDNNLVREFKRSVEDNFIQKHKVSDYADLLFISANHLNEVIKSKIGSTAKEYIQDRIILEAKRLAHFGDLSAKEVSFELGFEDPSHFGKFFKNCTGQSFTAFREQIR